MEWTYNSGTTTNNANTNYSGNAAVVSTSLYLKEGTYKFRYEHRAGVRSGYNRNTDSAGNQTFNYTTDQFAYSALTGASTMANATIVVPTNVVELTAKGLQLLTDSNTYVQGSTFYIGRYFDSTSTTYMPTGYISNFRVVKGQAIYNKSFTPTTTALTG